MKVIKGTHRLGVLQAHQVSGDEAQGHPGEDDLLLLGVQQAPQGLQACTAPPPFAFRAYNPLEIASQTSQMLGSISLCGFEWVGVAGSMMQDAGHGLATVAWSL